MDFTSASKEELTRGFHSTVRSHDQAREAERTQEIVQDLQMHRVQLEVQNRALREVQSELEEALKRYTDLFDNLPIGYVTLSPSGKILQANLTAARWLRRDRGYLTGIHMNWFLDPFDAGRFAAHLERCLRTHAEENCEITFRLENDLSLTVQLASHVAPFAGDRGPTIHTAMTNISRLTHTRVLIEDMDREQEAVAAIARGGSVESFASVSNLARTLLSTHRPSLAPEVLNVAERIEAAALRTEATLQHLMQYCSLGREGVARDPVNLDELVQQVLLEHRGAVEHRRADIQVARPLPTVRGSRFILAQVLANLLINALKSPAQAQPLGISIAAEINTDVVLLKIASDGLRLPETEQNFRVFERLHGASQFLADGVGFALVRRAIEGMNGRIWVESDLCQGHCFNIELPKL